MSTAKAITNEISQNVSTQIKLFRILIIGCVILFAIYIYLVGSITFNVVARKSLESTVLSLTGEVNTLELTYLTNMNSIDKEYAFSKGFVDARQSVFASRNINHVAIR